MSWDILSFSAAAEKMFGYVEAEVIGENVSMLMPPRTASGTTVSATIIATTGRRKIIGIGRVTTALHGDGNTFPDRALGRRSMGRRASESSLGSFATSPSGSKP